MDASLFSYTYAAGLVFGRKRVQLLCSLLVAGIYVGRAGSILLQASDRAQTVIRLLGVFSLAPRSARRVSLPHRTGLSWRVGHADGRHSFRRGSDDGRRREREWRSSSVVAGWG